VFFSLTFTLNYISVGRVVFGRNVDLSHCKGVCSSNVCPDRFFKRAKLEDEIEFENWQLAPAMCSKLISGR
jgi:hypothetical protein